MNKHKRGVSPVIATVLLISIVVILAAIIFLWARGFLKEGATKGDRAVEVSCSEVEFEWDIVQNAGECSGSPGLDIHNIGNVPIYGVVVKEWDEDIGSLDVVEIDAPASGGTILIGKSDTFCFINQPSGELLRVIPKLLAETGDGQKTAYTCPDKDGTTISFTGI